MKQFGHIMRNHRIQKQISQEQLAEFTGLHRTYISEVERGKRNVSLVNIHKICRALNVTLVDFFREWEHE
jgi:transcriptional regulator with XRE-family HTH domain